MGGFEPSGKVVLISGGLGGIGTAIAKEVMAANGKVFLGDIKPANVGLSEAREALSSKDVGYFQMDARSREQLQGKVFQSLRASRVLWDG